jgi:hypothetical protein
MRLEESSSSSWSKTWDLHDRRENGCQDDGLTLSTVCGGSKHPLARSRLNFQVGSGPLHCGAVPFESSGPGSNVHVLCSYGCGSHERWSQAQSWEKKIKSRVRVRDKEREWEWDE